jgi:drug/metabolite transporter (DMT)-like permease
MDGQRNILKGSVLALIAFFFMAIFGILTKSALQSGSYLWISFIAYLTGALLLTPYIARQGLGYLKSDQYGKLLGRAVFGTMASFFYTISIHYIPIVNSTLLFNTAPIFIPLLSVVFLHANIAKSVWLAVALGFLGIVIIIHPTAAIFTQTGNLLGLLSGLFLAIAYLLMKILTNTDPGMRIIFYYLGIGTLMQIPFLAFYERPDGLSLAFASLSGAALLLAQITLVNAYRFAQAAEIGVFQYASVVFVGLIGWVLWNQVPSGLELCGIFLVTLAGVLIIRSGKNSSLRL